MTTQETQNPEPLTWPLIATIAAASVAFVLWRAWVCDDAFISFRHVANCLAGHGPVFNPGFRVQGFTHPLWFLLLLVGGFGVEVYAWAVTLGLLCTATTVLLLGRLLRGTNQATLRFLILMGFLLSSHTFVEFQTSGLETSLSNLLIVALFGWLLARTDQGLPLPLIGPFVLCALLILTRPDHLFLVLPVFLYLVAQAWRRHQGRSLLLILPALLLLLSWYGFATLYYGSPLPNTAYAKVTLPPLEAITQGYRYLRVYLKWETFHSVVGLSVLVTAVIFLLKRRKSHNLNKTLLWCIVLGIMLNLGYVILIGGDFMRGRFFAPILVATGMLGLHVLGHLLPTRDLAWHSTVALALLLPSVVVFQMGEYLPVTFLSRLHSFWYQAVPTRIITASCLVLLVCFVTWILVHRHRFRHHSKARKLLFAILLVDALFISTMAGYREMRCLCASFFLATVIASMLLVRYPLFRPKGPSLMARTCCLILFAGVFSLVDLKSRPGKNLMTQSGIADEYSWYAGTWRENRFRMPRYTQKWIIEEWHETGQNADRYSQTYGPISLSLGAIGISGYEAGPVVTIIDQLGLTDAYIARCPPLPVNRIGHIERNVPAAYYESHGAIDLLPDWRNRLRNLDPTLIHDARIMMQKAEWDDPEAYQQWLDVQTVVTGNLFAWNRLRRLPAFAFPKR